MKAKEAMGFVLAIIGGTACVESEGIIATITGVIAIAGLIMLYWTSKIEREGGQKSI